MLFAVPSTTEIAVSPLMSVLQAENSKLLVSNRSLYTVGSRYINETLSLGALGDVFNRFGAISF